MKRPSTSSAPDTNAMCSPLRERMQSTPDVRVAAPPERLFHVGRKEYPLRFAAIDPLEAARPRAGSRFDVVGAGVLYAASEATCAYKEVIQRLRPAPGARRFAEEGYLNVGSIPASWRDARVLVEFRTVDALPFLDVERDATLTVLAANSPTTSLDTTSRTSTPPRFAAAIDS
ncbi:RES domain-containing protein [Pseudoclavibacter chungangensis]|uniref:RES domain-containing protein n=2 Tax=Pseudoclavibacter chungangensis TaxID=587635 RepID=A0A7J5BPR1_9MICO|nr:RES domain-containing protein [Pseudoclavibacter chungangensis]